MYSNLVWKFKKGFAVIKKNPKVKNFASAKIYNILAIFKIPKTKHLLTLIIIYDSNLNMCKRDIVFSLFNLGNISKCYN